MLKTLGNTESLTRPGKGRVGVGGDSRVAHCKNKLDENEIDNNEVSGVKIDNEVGKKSWNPSKSKNLSKSKKIESGFFPSGARIAFTKLRQVFIKTLILYYFNPKRYIWLKTDTSGSAMGVVLIQLISNDSGWWHPMAFFSWKMIPAEIRYET